MKNTKKSLVLSMVTLLLCLCTFVGSTFAWFTDTVSNTGNKIQAGTLDIDLLQRYDTMSAAQKKKAGTHVDNEYVSLDTEDLSKIGIFDYDKWEPGYTMAKMIKIVNKGNLALKFNLQFIAKNEDKSSTRLADVIDVYMKSRNGVVPQKLTLPNEFNETGLLEDGYSKTTLSELIDDLDGAAHGVMPTSKQMVSGSTSVECAIILHMRENAGNEYQGLSVGESLDIKLNATQYTIEKDGFGSDQYDKDAAIPWSWNGSADEEGLIENTDKEDKTVIIETPEQLAAFAKSVNGGKSYNGYKISLESDVDLNNISWMPIDGFGKLENVEFNGNGHSINNLFINSSLKTNYLSAFIGQTTGNLTIKNLIFNNTKVVAPGVNQVAAVVGLVYGNSLFENVVVNNSEINATSKAGALVGATGGDGLTLTINNCEVNNTKVNANYAYAVVAGFINENDSVIISGTEVNDSKATFVPDDSEFSGTNSVKYNGVEYEILNNQIWHIGGDQNGLPLWASKRTKPAPTAEIGGSTYTIKGDKFLTNNGSLTD